MIMCASASTVAAPPMSFFIISMALSGLRSSPPVSKHTPLPTSVTLGSPGFAPAQLDQPRRARASAARPTAWISGKFCLSRSSPTMRAEFRAVLLGERAGGGFELGRAHVVGRRVDEVARQRHALGDARELLAIDAVRQHQPHRLVLRLAVAREAICAEREGQRRKPHIVRRVGEAIDAGRQQRRAAGRAGTRCCSASAFDAEQHAAGAARRRQDQVPAGPRLEARGLDEGAGTLVELRA